MNSASSSQRVPILPVPGEGSSLRGRSLPADVACDPDQPTVISQRPPGTPSGVPRTMGHSDLVRQLSGERLNHFQLLEYVGGGGMGAVFRALDTMLNREVALKVLSRDQGADEETRRRFQNEAQSAARLDHEHIARVYYVGEDRGLNYIVFEFIEGVNLRDLVERQGPLPLPEALSYTLQMAHALAHACSRDVVHRDIKPSNVIITSSGRAKLVDMGLARLHQVQPDGGDLTASGVTLGTFDYISPEQARDPRSADVRSDIYSLGCTLYYMLTGRPPFPDGTVLQKLLQHNSDAPPDPREFDPSLPPGVSVLVAKMLAKDPLRRYQLPEELVTDLLLLAEQTGCVLPGTERTGWPAAAGPVGPSKSLVRHLPWLVPVSLLLMTAVVADWPLPWIDPPDDLAALERVHARSQRPRAARGDAATASEKPASGGRDEEQPQTRLDGDKALSVDPSDEDVGLAGSGPTVARPQTPAAPMPVDSAENATSAAGDSRTDATQLAVPATGRGRPSQNSVGTNAVDTSNTAVPEAVTPAEPVPEGVLVVGDRMQGPRRHASLVEACAAAKNGDVIELRFDGPREEPPLVLHNQRLEIRAGAGRRPALVFRPNDTGSTDRAMFGLSGGSLKLSQIDIELDLSRAAPSENWSLFSVDQSDGLRLEQCSLTIRNATASGGTYHDRVSFFMIGGGAAAEPMVMMPKGMTPPPPVQISLTYCLARGEADLVVNRDLRPLNFSCTNGLVAVSERLLAAGGGAAMPQEGARMHVDLDHVTVFVRQGLCRIAASEAAPGMPEVEVRLSDSIVMSDGPDPSLVEHVSSSSASRLQPLFHWEAVNSVYLGFRTFWKIAGPGSPRDVETKTYSEWTELWPAERDTRSGPLAWQLPPRRAIDSVSVADVEAGLAAQSSLVSSTGSSGRPAGVDFQLLPPTR